MSKCDFKKFQCNVIKITLEQVFKVTLLICSKKKNSHKLTNKETCRLS